MSGTSSTSNNLRMGPLALFTLMAVLCLAVLAVLAASTSHATMALAQRRAKATTQLYLDETAAQTFVAALDEAHGATFTESDLDAAAEAVREAIPPTVETFVYITTTLDDPTTASASFSCGNGRQLDITLHIEDDGSLSTQRWRMMAVVNDEPTIGNLYGDY